MKVKLIAYTPEPERVVAAAAKLCYSASDIDSLMNGLTVVAIALSGKSEIWQQKCLTLPMAKASGFSVQRPLPSAPNNSRWAYTVSSSV